MTTAVRWRGGWILQVDGTLEPGAVGPYNHVYGEDPLGNAIDITTDPTVTLTVAQIIQQWESSSGNLLCPLAYTETERENARVARGLPAITATAALTPLPKIYGATGAAGDATSLQGTPIAVTAPAEGQALVFLTGEWRPGGWNKGPRFVVGNALEGDTLAVCDYLDAGDGVQLQAALTAAAALVPDGDVWVRPGIYTPLVPLTVGQFVHLRGCGWGTQLAGTATNRQVLNVSSFATVEDLRIDVPVPSVGAAGTEVVLLAGSVLFRRAIITIAAQTAPQAANESLTAAVRSSSVGGGVHVEQIDLNIISFRALAIASDMRGFDIYGILGGNVSKVIDCAIASGGDIGYDLHGAVVATACAYSGLGRMAYRLTSTNAASSQRRGPILTASYARVLNIAGLAQFGVVFDTGTDAAGMRGAIVSDCNLWTTSVNVASAGVSLQGIGDGAKVSNVCVEAFPLGVDISATQARASLPSLTIIGSTTPTTDASGTAIIPNSQVF